MSEVITGEIELADEDNDAYEVAVNLRKMTWGDNMIHVRFQLLIETIGDDGDETDPKARMAALKELIAGFDELTAYLNRVAKVTRNGARIPFTEVPMDFVKDVMEQIQAAQRGSRAEKK